MSTAEILLLGAIAGFTIFLGLPLGRIAIRTRACTPRSLLAAGILVFLLWDVLVHGVGPVEEALEEAAAEGGSWLEFAGLEVAARGWRRRRPHEPRLLRPVARSPAPIRSRRDGAAALDDQGAPWLETLTPGAGSRC